MKLPGKMLEAPGAEEANGEDEGAESTEIQPAKPVTIPNPAPARRAAQVESSETKAAKLRTKYLGVLSQVASLLRMVPSVDDWVWARGTELEQQLLVGMEDVQNKAQAEGWYPLIVNASSQWKRTLTSQLPQLCNQFLATEPLILELEGAYNALLRMNSARKEPAKATNQVRKAKPSAPKAPRTS